MSETNKTMSVSEWGMLLALSLLWGGSFFFQEIAVRELPTFTVVVVRVVLAAAILLIVLRIMAIPLPTGPAVWLAFFGMGLLNNVIPFSLIVWGQSHIASGVASILNATTPLFTVVVAHMLTTDEKLTGPKVFGVLCGIVGVTMMIGTDVLQSLGINVVAQLAVLAAALSYAFAGIFGRRFSRMGISPIATATGQVAASSIILTPVMLVVDKPWTLPTPGFSTVAALLALAALSTSLAYILFFRILATAGATNLLLVTFLIPVSAGFLGIFFLGERLDTEHIVGMALIGLGLAAIDGRPFSAFTRQSSKL